MAISFEQRIQSFQKGPFTPESGDEFAKLDYDMTHSAEKVSQAVQQQFEVLRGKFANAGLECRLTLDRIEAKNFFTIGRNYFDVNALIDGLLTQDTIVNPLDRQSLSEIDLAKVCAHFGVDVEAFKQLWPKAKEEFQVHNDAILKALPTNDKREEYLRRDCAAEAESDYKRDARKRLFNELCPRGSFSFAKVAKITAIVLLAFVGLTLCYFIGRTFLWNKIQLP
jgi:hypothetical protein